MDNQKASELQRLSDFIEIFAIKYPVTIIHYL